MRPRSADLARGDTGTLQVPPCDTKEHCLIGVAGRGSRLCCPLLAPRVSLWLLQDLKSILKTSWACGEVVGSWAQSQGPPGPGPGWTLVSVAVPCWAAWLLGSLWGAVVAQLPPYSQGSAQVLLSRHCPLPQEARHFWNCPFADWGVGGLG
jgi:hypothetical protein